MNTDRLTSRTVSALGWSSSTILVKTTLNVGSVAILARLLTPNDYGVVFAAIVFVELGAMLSVLGLGTTIIQRAEVDRDHIAAALGLSLTIASMLVAAQWFLAPLVASSMQVPELRDATRALAFLIPLRSFTILANSLLARNMRFKTAALIPVASWFAATAFVAIPLAYAGLGYWALLLSMMAEALCSFLLYLITVFQWLEFRLPTRKALIDLLPRSGGFFVSQMSTYVATYADISVVGRYLGRAQLGFYAKSYQLIALPANLFGNATRATVFPVMSRIQDDGARLRSAFLKGVSIAAIATIPASAFLATFSNEVVHILLGEAWLPAAGPFMIFAVAIYFRVGAKTCATVILARGRSSVSAFAQGFYAVFIVAGALVSAPFGVEAVAGAVLVAVAVNFVAYATIGASMVEVSLKEFALLHVPPARLALLIICSGIAIKHLLGALPDYVQLTVAAVFLLAIVGPITYHRASLVLGHHTVEALSSVAGPRAAKYGWNIR